MVKLKVDKVDIKTVSAVAHNVKEVRRDYCDSSIRDVVEFIPVAEYVSNQVCKRYVGDLLNLVTNGLDMTTKFAGMVK